MDQDAFRISKRPEPVEVWVHPEGRVLGAIFLQSQSDYHFGAETPREVLDGPAPFLVVQCEGPEPIRFYNKRSIVRMEYTAAEAPSEAEPVNIGCRLSMMDGALLVGTIREYLSPSHSRLYDYLNLAEQRFIELQLGEGQACLVNKAYIVKATPA